MCSRIVVGLLIGILNILAYGLSLTLAVWYLVEARRLQCTRQTIQRYFSADYRIFFRCWFVLVIVVDATGMIIATAALMRGIIKRHVMWMRPWQLLTVLNIIAHCILGFYLLFTIENPKIVLLWQTIVVVIQCWTIYSIHMLHREMSLEGKIPIEEYRKSLSRYTSFHRHRVIDDIPLTTFN